MLTRGGEREEKGMCDIRQSFAFENLRGARVSRRRDDRIDRNSPRFAIIRRRCTQIDTTKRHESRLKRSKKICDSACILKT